MQRRRAVTLIQLLATVAAVLILAMFLFPTDCGRPLPYAHRSACQANLKTIGLACAVYREDFEGRWPLVKVSNTPGAVYGWADALQPYMQLKAGARHAEHFQCPTEPTGRAVNPRRSGYTDYYLNGRLGGMAVKQVKSPERTVAFGDGNSGSDLADARYSLTALPSAWRKNQKSPAYRHLDGTNYAFADGRVKWLMSERVGTTPPEKSQSYTFAPR